MVRHRQAWPRTDGARLHRGPDHIDAQPCHGRRVAACRHASRTACRAALRGSDHPPALGLRLRCRRTPHALDSRRYDRASRRRISRRACDHHDSGEFRPGDGAFGFRLRDDRHWSRRSGNVAAGTARQAGRAGQTRSGSHRRLGDDADRLHRHGGRRRAFPRSVFLWASSCRLGYGFGHCPAHHSRRCVGR